jgi:hypothetical protein
MKTTITNSLTTNYGFLNSAPNVYEKGQGSISNGRMVTIMVKGKTARVIVERWWCDGISEEDTKQEWTCWLGDVWEFIPMWALC